ncbi:MAG: hypothetical protein DKT66_23175 [Candidatus Melainabacteria bacterium]|nr:MAG: hypothetical protein DKT66_23175 [Candidatus Melainabacteria bacterium]
MDLQISRDRNDKSWIKLRDTLVPGGMPDLWAQAFFEYFEDRLESRYFEPIAAIDKLKADGKGFSIVALQCSLIEFLESTIEGKKYIFRAKETDIVYGDSADMFKRFFQKRRPFKAYFADPDLRDDFYKSVRCGLLHEARTKKEWIIWKGDGSEKPIEEALDRKIIWRVSFQKHLKEAIEIYRERLMSCETLQRRFIAKIDSLCDLTN